MTRRELLLSLGWPAPTEGDKAARRWRRAGETLSSPPWYLHLAAGVGSFLGALLAGFFFVLSNFTNSWADAVIALALLVGAGLIAREFRSSILAEQAVWLLTGGCQMLLAHALEDAHLLNDMSPLWFCLVQVAVIAWVPRRAIRVASSALAALLFSVWWLDSVTYALDVPALVCTALVVGAFLVAGAPDPESGMQGPSARAWLPVAFGLALAQLVYFSFHALVGVSLGWTSRLSFELPLLATVGVAGLGIWTLMVMRRELDPRAAVVSPLTLGAFLAVSGAAHSHPAILVALVYLLISHLRSDRRLELLSLVTLAAVLVRAYYDLSYPLAVRAGWLAATGGLALGLAWWMSRREPSDPGSEAHSDAGPQARRRLGALAATLALALAIPAFGVWQKERQLGASRVVVLELRPVDPRSWMMGDYMRLSFQVQRDIEKALGSQSARAGRAVLRVDAQDVARFERIWTGTGDTLGAGEVLLRWRQPKPERGRIDLGMDSFFFPEGEGERYSGSRWAEVALSPVGEAILVGVRPVDG